MVKDMKIPRLYSKTATMFFGIGQIVGLLVANIQTAWIVNEIKKNRVHQEDFRNEMRKNMK